MIKYLVIGVSILLLALSIVYFANNQNSLTFYSFENGFPQVDVNKILDSKHEAWYCNITNFSSRDWCIAGTTNQIRIIEYQQEFSK